MIDQFSRHSVSDFRKSLRQEFNQYVSKGIENTDLSNCLKIDLHCHDLNSDVPDELWGRILGLPESWLKTKNLVKCLEKNACDVVTITNHNNARSCWDLLDKGRDVLVGAEFTCYFPEHELFVHVLTYGFSPQQETILNKKRKNIYQFLRYCAEFDIPVILPHPLYFYTRNDKIDLALFEKFALLFSRFEVLNGQRDQWQSVLTLNWASSLTPEKLHHFSKKHGINPFDYAVDPNSAKTLTGGSDDHMGIFAGECGSFLHVNKLKEMLQTRSPSELALEAIRNGNITPYGHISENQKLNIALLDYFSQVATKIDDPGLLRILFHRGEVSDKLACFTISNLLLEMRKSKNSQKFFGFIHDAMQGKKVNKLLKWKVKKDYRFCIEHLDNIAHSKKQSPESFVATVNQAIPALFNELSLLVIKRIKKASNRKEKMACFSTEEITRHFEIPCQVSALFFAQKKNSQPERDKLAKLIDQISFPALVGTVLLGSTLASTRLLYQNRSFLNDFSNHIGQNQHPKRALYLTDTLQDKNGVSSSLTAKLREIQREDMPIDFLICHADAAPEPHLHVVRPLTSMTLTDFGGQEIRIPDIMEVAQIFYHGGYDRVICSTEGPMAFVSLFIKHMFNIPSYFFMHTDWIEFIKNTTDFTQHERDRIRRVLRFFYKQYSGVFVLNSDHQKWLTGHEMQLEADNVFLTAHHSDAHKWNCEAIEKSSLFDDANSDTPIMMCAGRLSKEKGLFDLPDIYQAVCQHFPNTKLVIAGTGPAESELRQLLPDALFLGWVDKNMLASLYQSLDIFVFPSRFDTFGNVILEAFSHGMPVIAYDCKGPKDIIQHQENGFLVGTADAMSQQIVSYFRNPIQRVDMRAKAIRRSKDFQAGPIMGQFLTDLGLNEHEPTLRDVSVA